MARVLKWLDQCDTNHYKCRSSNTHSLPSRLIDVTEIHRGNTTGVKLTQTAIGQTGRYICLSHCWGKVDIQCCTTKDSLVEAMDFIDCRLFPKNFQDAITITRRLGIRYIWIDSVCIIQGDAQDWDVESARMADIYRYGYLTIAATSSADSTGGCFSTTNSDLCLALSDDASLQILLGARMCDKLGFLKNDEELENRFPLFRRGWVFQELLISRRILLCNYGELAFECLEGKTCECGSPSFSPHGSGSLRMTKSTTKHRLLMAKRLTKGHDIADLWRGMVSSYMLLNLTKMTDILPAVSACARVMSEVIEDQYLAGMWRKTLCRELCWANRSKKRMPRDREWTAPSWSWASIPSGQNISTLKLKLWSSYKPVLDGAIRSVDCLPKGINEFGEVSHGTGHLKLDTALFPCFVRRFCHGVQSLEQPIRKNTQFGIHSRHPTPGLVATCQLPEPGLDSHGGYFEFYLDVPPKDALQFNSYHFCSTCSLSPILLLHICHIVDFNGLCLDYYMILKEANASHKFYERVGLTLFLGHTVEQRRRWSQEVWDKGAVVKREISVI
jgi:hypothetical protein